MKLALFALLFTGAAQAATLTCVDANEVLVSGLEIRHMRADIPVGDFTLTVSQYAKENLCFYETKRGDVPASTKGYCFAPTVVDEETGVECWLER